ncbi:TolC family outer membrane protein [Vreelandella salicampi]|uniref:TolC family outer membrane protein n=1 Tax=Vreelandella salicampi TaxID=1449798 RepID=A0A7Z0LJV2_9GAMM|nr:TolC family outer membrane protein [Halomonas salicampi]NYS60346.1 TolC family outer membrane protein [Halomonas salicampi]
MERKIRTWFRFAPMALAIAMASPLYAQDDVPAGDDAVAEFEALGDAGAAKTQLPSLPALFARALDNDAELTRQRYELEATREEIALARSQLLPQVTASGSYLWQDSSNIQTEPDDFGLDQPSQRPGEIDETFWQVQLQQPLFSLERWRGMDVANAQVSTAELQLAVVERDLALSVSEAYVQAYLASQRLGLLNSQQESLKLQTRQAQRAFDLGVGNRVDLLEAQSRFDQAIADAVEAENELDNALSELARLTGTRPDMRGLAVGELANVSLDSDWGAPDDWVAQVGKNLDVLLAQEEKRISQEETSTRQAGYFPELNLNMSYSDRESDDELRSSEDYRASVELSMPLYRGGYTNASVRQGEKRIKASQAGVDNQRNLAVQEVRTRLRSLNGGIRRLEALSQAIESSQLFLNAAERGEQLGLRDLVDVLDARASLYDQRINYVDTLGEYALDRLALQSAVGDLESEDLAKTMRLLASMTANINSPAATE